MGEVTDVTWGWSLAIGASSVAKDLGGFWEDIEPGVFALLSLAIVTVTAALAVWVGFGLWSLRILGRVRPRAIRIARRLVGGRPRIRLGSFTADRALTPLVDGWVFRLEEMRRERERQAGREELRSGAELATGFDFTSILSQSSTPVGFAAMVALALRYFLPYDLFTVSGHLHDGSPASATLVVDHARFGSFHQTVALTEGHAKEHPASRSASARQRVDALLAPAADWLNSVLESQLRDARSGSLVRIERRDRARSITLLSQAVGSVTLRKEIYEQAADADPRNEWARFNLGVLAIQDGANDEAIGHLTYVLKKLDERYYLWYFSVYNLSVALVHRYFSSDASPDQRAADALRVSNLRSALVRAGDAFLRAEGYRRRAWRWRRSAANFDPSRRTWWSRRAIPLREPPPVTRQRIINALLQDGALGLSAAAGGRALWNAHRNRGPDREERAMLARALDAISRSGRSTQAASWHSVACYHAIRSDRDEMVASLRRSLAATPPDRHLEAKAKFARDPVLHSVGAGWLQELEGESVAVG